MGRRFPDNNTTHLLHSLFNILHLFFGGLISFIVYLRYEITGGLKFPFFRNLFIVKKR